MATQTARGYVVLPTTSFTPTTPPDLLLKQPQPHRSNAHLIVKMANRGYDVVVDVDQEVRFPSPSYRKASSSNRDAGRSRPHRSPG